MCGQRRRQRQNTTTTITTITTTMTTLLTRNNKVFHQNDKWSFPAKDVYRRNLPRRPQTHDKYTIVGFDDISERMQVKRNRDDKIFHVDLYKMIQRNYYKCKLYFMNNNIPRDRYWYIRPYREIKNSRMLE